MGRRIAENLFAYASFSVKEELRRTDQNKKCGSGSIKIYLLPHF
jgi:hypothetical protein